MDPPVGVINPAMVSRSNDLPAPDSPRSMKYSPGWMVKEIPLREKSGKEADMLFKINDMRRDISQEKLVQRFRGSEV